MFYYTLHIDMDAPQYAHVDVPWDIQDAWMFYYTHYRDVYVRQYVSPGAVSQLPAH